MKRFLKNAIALTLALSLLIGSGGNSLAAVADEIDRTLNPAERIELTVPERFQDGGNWFFFPETGYTASEKSPEKLYIPIQRTGDPEAEADVVLKVTDLSAQHDVNYRVEIYKEDLAPDILLDDRSIVDLTLHADGQEEIPLTDQNSLGQAVYDAGEVEVVNAAGETVGTVTATPLDEDGDPIPEESAEDAPAASGEASEPAQEPEARVEQPQSATEALRAARNAYTGTTSDRQELEGGDLTDLMKPDAMSEEEFNQQVGDVSMESYPGKEYHLHFTAGETAKFLVITPLYSPAAEGDGQLLLFLKDPGENYAIGEDVNPVSVTIVDEDEPAPVTVSMGAETVTAQDGKAVITVTREGRINAIQGVMLSSWGGSAKAGDEYSGVGAKLYFPMGITSRSVEIPVYHGTEEKDFYLTINALNDEQIGTATTHVVIPPAQEESPHAALQGETQEDGVGQLLDFHDEAEANSGRKLIGPMKLRNCAYSRTYLDYDSDTSMFGSTPDNKENSAAEVIFAPPYKYAYDGVFVDSWYYVHNCDAEARLWFHWPDRWSVERSNKCGKHEMLARFGQNWGQPEAPVHYSVTYNNYDNDTFGTSKVDGHLSGIFYIKRAFRIKVEDAQVKPLLGRTDQEVRSRYQAFLLDKKTDNFRTLYTGDSFAINAKDTFSPLRLAGVEVKVANGKWQRVATIDGKSDTCVVEMTPELIDSLAAKGAINWQRVSMGGWNASYEGSLTFRPVFDYRDVTVELLKDTEGFGEMTMPAPLPGLLYDFNADEAMHSRILLERDMAYKGYRNGSDEYYTFADQSNTDSQYVDLDAKNVNTQGIRWMKMRLRNLTGTQKLEMCYILHYTGGTKWEKVTVPLNQDTQWHEYVVCLPDNQVGDNGRKDTTWQGTITHFQFCPGGYRVTKADMVEVDYMAFFGSESSARTFRSGSSKISDPGQFTYHLGDVLDLETSITVLGNQHNMKPDGVQYRLRRESSTGALVNNDDMHYINGKLKLELAGRTSGGAVVDRPYYSLKPIYTQKDNSITVRVADRDYDRLNMTKGLFNGLPNSAKSYRDGYYYFVVAREILTNEFYELVANTAEPTASIPKWTFHDGSVYYGENLYFLSNPLPEENVVTLSVESGSDLTYASISGKAVTPTMNLASGRSGTDQNPLSDAFVAHGDNATLTKDGVFSLPAVLAKPGGKMRFVVIYNGVTSIQEVKIPAAGAPTKSVLSLKTGKNVDALDANVGTVTVQNFATTGAHLVSCYASQTGQITGALHAVTMNGGQLTFTLQVAKGNDYTLNNQTYHENIKEVKLYFLDQATGQKHAEFSSNVPASQQGKDAKWGFDPETGEFVLTIRQFSPDKPSQWTYGDVLMAQIVTDKKMGLQDAKNDKGVTYDPVSTGYGVFADPDYAPKTFQFDVDSVASDLKITPVTDEEGKLLADEDGKTRYSYGTFPYLGQISFAIHTLTRVVASAFYSTESAMVKESLDDMANSQYGLVQTGVDSQGVNTWKEIDPDDGEDIFVNTDPKAKGYSRAYAGSLSLLFEIEDTFYGGVRFLIGAVWTYGGGRGFEKQKNPYQTLGGFVSSYSSSVKNDAALDADPEIAAANRDLIQGNRGRIDPVAQMKKMAKTTYAGPYFKLMLYLGVYLEYGYIEISKDNGKEKSHEMVFMGAGGFMGAGATIGYTWGFLLGPIPAYVNLEAGVDLRIFLGSEADPKKTLESFNDEKELKGQDFGFTFEFKGRLFAGGTIGAGFYKVLGVRASVVVGFDAGYGKNITKWFPNLFNDGWGYVMEITLTGTVDLIITSIDLYSATWPLPVARGFLYYFQEVRRANRCISYVENGIQKGNGNQWARDTAQRMADELKKLVDADMLASANKGKSTGTLPNVDTIKEKTQALKRFAYDNDVISMVARNAVDMNKQGGIIGASINASLQSDDSESSIPFHTNEHVDSQWVADQGQLQAGYGVTSSQALVQNAFAQPASKILSIGNGKYLMVFLDDTRTRDKMQAATLKWTVYDAGNGTWTAPRTVQNDATADSKPSLTDAGDKVILSWASSTDAKYQALKEEVRGELTAKHVSDTDVDVQEALEKDPARVMANQDIFTVEFDKANQTFGAITQLTDDLYYDDYPQAVYDAETGDYLVLYSKTAQDDPDYTDTGEKLLDLVGASADPNKSYSVVAYMLYNNQTEAEDTQGQTHAAGWARDYYFPNETEESLEKQAASLTQWGGQRFLRSSLRTEDGGQLDPPINDLTVAAGYNGLAAYAFTVDQDFNLKTAEDRELYMQFYNFKTHGTYVPVKVAGSVTEVEEVYDSAQKEFVNKASTRQVEVGSPRLIRNGGHTYLFWREDGQTLKYLDITNLLNAKVAKVDDPKTEADWTYALKSDGSFAVDSLTGLPYQPDVRMVDFGSMMTDSAIEITDYEVITAPNGDGEDDLYVVWTDSVTHTVTNEIGESYDAPAQEIYASAMIHQDKRTETVTNEEGQAETQIDRTVNWSKPYRLTRENNFNDGLALALDPEGNLIIVHNQYSKKMAESEEEMYRLIQEGKIGVTQDREGNYYAVSLEYNSPVSLMVTKCEKIGSVQATQITYSDEYPVAGETVDVTVAVENVGLTDAEGFKLDFYEFKDGKQGRKIGPTFVSNARFPVNTVMPVTVPWTVPEDGPEGYRIQVLAQEKNGAGYYDPTDAVSAAFTPSPVYDLSISDVTQDGDKFLVTYSVENAGNQDAPAGTTAGIRLVGLHGDLNQERFGYIEEKEIYSKDITSDLKAKTARTEMVTNLRYTVEESGEEIRNKESTWNWPESIVDRSHFEETASVEIPASLFQFCGYDAIQLVITDEDGLVVEESDQFLVNQQEPMHLSLNQGKAVSVEPNASKRVDFTYDTTVFIDRAEVVYSVKDPTVATVSAEGELTGLAEGTTTLTATLLPSGRSVSVPVKVQALCDLGDSCPLNGFGDLKVNGWYHDGVHWALANGVMNGVAESRFNPNGEASRAMIVTMLYRLEGAPEVSSDIAFTDVKEGTWYAEAVRWAAANGIVNGYGDGRFGPEKQVTREQLAVMLCRYAKYKGLDTSEGELKSLIRFTDSPKVAEWAVRSMRWAVDAGIIEGVEKKLLSPRSFATRAQVATMLMRYALLEK